MTTLLLFLLILSILVFAHEFGHFYVAKKLGIAVEEFGFGFPPRAWSVKRNGTVYSLNWIPIGGFVKVKGESGEARYEPDSFAAKKPWQRFLVLGAGVAMNYVLAALVLGVSFTLGSPIVLSDGIPTGAAVRQQEMVVSVVVPESPAAQAGMAAGDILVSLDGQTFTDEVTARTYIHTHESGVDIRFHSSAGPEKEAKLVPVSLAATGGAKAVGVGLSMTGIVSLPVWRAIPYGFVAAGNMVREVVIGFWGLLRSLFVDHKVSAELSGPVGIAAMTGDVAKLGFLYLLPFIAVLSANLAVVNLLPFPALDGGRIVFLAIEKLRRKPNDERVETLIHNLGFVILLLLVLAVTLRDVFHLIRP